jgi:hypothetical protein
LTSRNAGGNELLGFDALSYDLACAVPVLVDPGLETCTHRFVEVSFIIPADNDIAIADCWTTRNQFGLVEAACDASAVIFFYPFFNIPART